jgi:hypothetical protein
MGVHSCAGTTVISTWNERLGFPLHSLVHFQGLKARGLSLEETSLLEIAGLSQFRSVGMLFLLSRRTF